MVTITNIVENEISKKPYLQEALIRGLINYGSLADELIPIIEKELKKDIKHSAVMMALRRLSDKLVSKSPKSFTYNTDISLMIKSNLFNIAFKKSNSINKKIPKLYDITENSSGDFLAINQGSNEITIISNKKYQRKIEKILFDEKMIQKIDEVAALSLSLSIELMDTPGFYYLVTRALTWECVNIIESVSTPTELILILNEDDITKSYETLKRLFQK